jgi:hypothetical protein
MLMESLDMMPETRYGVVSSAPFSPHPPSPKPADCRARAGAARGGDRPAAPWCSAAYLIPLQVLRRLLGDGGVPWFESLDHGSRLTRLAPVFKGCGALVNNHLPVLRKACYVRRDLD